MSGTTVIIGANREDSSEHPPEPSPNEGAKDSGAAYVYERGDTTWSERAFLKTTANSGPSNWGDAFGYAVGTSGDTVVVGAPSEGSASTGIDSTPDESAPDSGAVYVFVREGTGWIQQAYLKPADPGAWQEGDFFGS